METGSLPAASEGSAKIIRASRRYNAATFFFGSGDAPLTKIIEYRSASPDSHAVRGDKITFESD